MKSSYPHWAYRTHREFKAKKRADIRALLSALDRYRNGCAYCPTGADGLMVDAVAELLRVAQDELSVNKWGR